MADADGILGVAGLKNEYLLVDFRNNRVKISRSRASATPMGFSRVDGKRLGDGLLTVVARIGGVRVQAVIDTGYTEWLTLPPDVIAALRLPWQSLDRGSLADGSECLFDVCVGTVMWDGKERRILVDKADTDPLVGMALLKGYELRMEVRSRGKVTIKQLRRG